MCGCASSKKMIITESLDETPVITGSIVNPAVFEKGGSLILGSFKPGSNAAADDTTDHLSMMIIKGINDTLPAINNPFTIVSDDQKNTDCVLEGYIEDYSKKGNAYILSVDGEIWLKATGEKIFLFQTSAIIKIKTQNPNTIAYEIGIAVAHYIGSQVKEPVSS